MTICGTDDWMAPEVILGLDYGQPADVFSFGIVLLEIISRTKVSWQRPRPIALHSSSNNFLLTTVDFVESSTNAHGRFCFESQQSNEFHRP
jgi:serine/threonine protein kinase